MKKEVVFILVSTLFGGLFASCSANQGFVSSLTSSDISQMLQFEPMAYVGTIEKNEKFTYHDSLSNEAKRLFNKEVLQSNTFPITGNISIEDSLINLRVQSEIYVLMSKIENSVRYKGIPIPPTIDSILEAKNERFGLLTYNWGLTQTSGNYPSGSQIAINTMGKIYRIPCEDMTRSDIVIVDSQNNNLVYVATAHSSNCDPLNADTYRKQKVVLLKKYRK